MAAASGGAPSDAAADINIRNGVELEFTSKDTCNSGQWVTINAVRAFRNGLETGVLRVTTNGRKEDFVD